MNEHMYLLLFPELRGHKKVLFWRSPKSTNKEKERQNAKSLKVTQKRRVQLERDFIPQPKLAVTRYRLG